MRYSGKVSGPHEAVPSPRCAASMCTTQPERGTIPQPKPRADDDQGELVNNQRTTDEQPRSDASQDGVGGRTNFVQQPD